MQLTITIHAVSLPPTDVMATDSGLEIVAMASLWVREEQLRNRYHHKLATAETTRPIGPKA